MPHVFMRIHLIHHVISGCNVLPMYVYGRSVCLVVFVSSSPLSLPCSYALSLSLMTGLRCVVPDVESFGVLQIMELVVLLGFPVDALCVSIFAMGVVNDLALLLCVGIFSSVVRPISIASAPSTLVCCSTL